MIFDAITWSRKDAIAEYAKLLDCPKSWVRCETWGALVNHGSVELDLTLVRPAPGDFRVRVCELRSR
jgi:hypothetical protein